MPYDWLTPSWSAPANVRALCTTRAGGVSTGTYASLNLGDHVGDAPQAVEANRRVLGSALEGSASRAQAVYLSQVHGTQAVLLSRNTPDRTVADGCVTAERGVACTIMVADCLPVLFTNEQGTAVAAAHAGWRGLAQGVLEQTHSVFMPASGKEGGKTLAWLGPCIGPAAFEVGDEVRAAFVADAEDATGMFKPHAPDKWLADLQGLARLRLKRMGINAIYGNDGSSDWCTVSNPSRFFSHRRDGVSGRFAACIWLD